MEQHSLQQGSPEWLAYRAKHRNASDAPAMMGVSPYKTRNELLREAYTGTAAEVDAHTQARFDDGHRFEALARERGEELVGETLYQVVGSLGNLSASFDGLTICDDVNYEHKTLNAEIRAAATAADLGKHFHVQVEQQMLISGADRTLFHATKWDNEGSPLEEKYFWIEPDLELRAAIVAGWEQFEVDLANYVHVEVLPAAIAAPVQDLPALSIRVDGVLTTSHNLGLFGDRLTQFIADINTAPDDDQSFADAEQAIKVMERAEEALGAAEASALGQVSSVDEMVRTIATYKELARKTRLMLKKMVDVRKETVRIEIQQAAKDKAAAHIATLNASLGKPYMPAVPFDFAAAMKGKKMPSSLRDAADTELARFKIEANAIADKIQINFGTLRELAADFPFLFADTAQIVQKAPDDLTALVQLRIGDHQRAEVAKAEALRAKIAEEERVKAENAAKETIRLAQVESDRKAKELAEAERVRIAEDTRRQLDQQAASIASKRAAEPPAAATAPAPAVVATVEVERTPIGQVLHDGLQRYKSTQPALAAAPTAPPSLRLGQINERIAPLSISADGLRSLGFEPAARDKAAQMYHERDFPSICAALVRHLGAVQTKQAA